MLYSHLSHRQPIIYRLHVGLPSFRHLSHRQPIIFNPVRSIFSLCDLLHRQPRIGQEESNLPVEQAVNNQNHQVLSWWFFV
ncbi:hypothetical protein EDL57_11315 [Vibrio cholerae]|nr:hypothetical protein [Vibrio cholerae]EGR2121021.1 hypothetical protein [Vibrio cholerae]EGR2127454.1 hypothetical protein [Vibrio cholerae]